MYNIDLPDTINRIMVIFYGLRLWNMTEGTAFRSIALKVFHFSYFLSFLASIVVKAVRTSDSDEFVFFIALSIIVTVHVIRMLYIILKSSETINLIYQMGTHSTTEMESFIHVDKKIKKFMKFAKTFILLCAVEVSMFIILPAIWIEVTLINVAFPLGDHRNVFWIKQTFVLIGGVYSVLSVFLSVIIWYLMLSAAIKYDMLGYRMRNLGVMSTATTDSTVQKVIISKTIEQQMFLKDLIETIKTHQKTNK